MGEILVIPNISGKDLSLHTDLCGQLEGANFCVTLAVPDHLLASIPSSFRGGQRRLLQIHGDEYDFIGASLSEDVLSTRQQVDKILRLVAKDVEDHLADRSKRRNQPPLICAVIDLEMGWIKELFLKFNIPVFGFAPFGACTAVLEWGGWKTGVGDTKPGEVPLISGLPEEMELDLSDFKLRPVSDLPPYGRANPADQPVTPPELKGLAGLMLNTCGDLERPFIDYLTTKLDIRVWCVGPLLAEQRWKPQVTCMNLFGWVGSKIRGLVLGVDGAKVGHTKDALIEGRTRQEPHQSMYTEKKVKQWLDSKLRRSVLYVAFVGKGEPTREEYQQIAQALEQESTPPFIWVINHGSGISEPISGGPSEEGYFPHDLDNEVGDRGLIIRGSALHLPILRHPSTGGFLTNCEWTSMAAALRCGLPILACPTVGNHYNAKLVVSYLKVGYLVADDVSKMVQKEDLLKGIEMLMRDEKMHKWAGVLRANIEKGFRESFVAPPNALEEAMKLLM